MITKAFCSIAFRDEPIEKIIPALASIGYDAVEAWGGHVEGKSRDELADIKKMADDHGLGIEVLSPYFWLTNSEELRQESLERARWFVDYGHQLGCRKIRTFTDAGPTGIGSDAATPEHWRIAVESLETITALDRDMLFVVETHEKTLADTPSTALRLLREVDVPNLKLNFQFLTGDPLKAYETVKPHIFHVHLQGMDENEQHTYFEQDAGNVAKLLRQLKADDYDESVSVEYCWKGVEWTHAESACAILNEHLS